MKEESTIEEAATATEGETPEESGAELVEEPTVDEVEGEAAEGPDAELEAEPEAEDEPPEEPLEETADAPVEEPAADEQEEEGERAHWYALQVYSGHENKVRTLLESRIAESTNPNVIIHQVLVPTQEVMEIKKGKKTRVTKNLYPGYILVEALMNDETQYFINAISGIIKFLGAGATPQPLREREVNKILGRIEEVREPVEVEEIPFQVGDAVDVTEGPFSDFSGVVEEVYPEKGKVKVTVSLFGRPTAVELDYLQLKKT